MKNYFNSLTESEKKTQLSKCRFMDLSEFDGDNQILKNKEIVIVGCGAQGLNQGLNMRDSGLNISYNKLIAIIHLHYSDSELSNLMRCFFCGNWFV